MATNRYIDLLQQGFMRPAKKRRHREPVSAFDIADAIRRETGIAIEYTGDKYRIPHPAGHDNYVATAADARRLARAMATM